ncbi:MAG: hypothetical protein RLZZ219_1641 [Cyanobacteriota bacterium]
MAERRPMPTGGLEPPRPKPLEPKPSASTNSARWAGRDCTGRSEWGQRPHPTMLASLGGSLALALGMAVMLVPLLSPELSRPRDAAWGAVLLLLGLVLITGADRLSGSPMLAVLCGGLLIGRLGGEVMQGRWRQLTPEEQQRLGSLERWQSSVGELGTTLSRSGGALRDSLVSLTAALGRGRGRSGMGGSAKRWVRPEPITSAGPSEGPVGEVGAPEAAPTTASELATGTMAAAAQISPPSQAMPDTSAAPVPPTATATVVRSFAEIDALIEAASGEAG